MSSVTHVEGNGVMHATKCKLIVRIYVLRRFPSKLLSRLTTKFTVRSGKGEIDRLKKNDFCIKFQKIFKYNLFLRIISSNKIFNSVFIHICCSFDTSTFN